MSFFLKRMLTQQGYRHLFFYSYYTYLGVQFHVSVCARNEAPAIYELSRSNGRWQLDAFQHCPDWLSALEAELNDAIMAHEAH